VTQPTDRATHADILRGLAQRLDGGAPTPYSIDLTGRSRIAIHISETGSKKVDTALWGHLLGLDEPGSFGKPFEPDSRPAWRKWGARGEWMGWTVEVWCAVDEPDRLAAMAEAVLQS
jgi:hypothetical protein